MREAIEGTRGPASRPVYSDECRAIQKPEARVELRKVVGRPVWAEYIGGGGGTGSLATASDDTVRLTIYHQAYDGAKNYHEIPGPFVPYMLRAIRNNFEKLTAEAISILEQDMKAAAKEASEELAAIMRDAGISPES